MSQFQIVSDLHIEYRTDKIPNPLDLITPKAETLILAGDIGSFYKIKQLRGFLEQLCPYFKVVLYVPGNHEYYEQPGYEFQTMQQLYENILDVERDIPNLYILNRACVRIENVCIVGCTLWSEAKVRIPRFILRIKDLSATKYASKHNADLEYIKKMMDYCNKNNLKLLVVSHYCPTYNVISNKRARDKYISLYATDLDKYLSNEFVHTWVCGHIHENFDLITDKGTRLVGNQKGKPKDKITDFVKDKVITV